LQALSLGQVPQWLPPVRQRTEAVMSALAAYLDRNTLLCLALMVVSSLPVSVLVAHITPLDSDEIYTYSIAQQPTVGKLIQLSRLIDLHPPLHYLAVREALKLPLPHWLGARLPSIIALQLAMICVFWLLKRQFGNAVGLLGTSVLWFSAATEFSWNDRPYALWLFFLSLAALLWTVCVEEDRKRWHVVALSVAAFGMTLTHMLGLTCLLPFFLAEAVRYARRGRADWPVWLALFLPCLMVFAYAYQIQGMSPNSFPARYLPSFDQAVGSYERLASDSVYALIGAVFAASLLKTRASAEEHIPKSFHREHWVLAWTLLFMPAVVELAARVHTFQFSYRYGIAGTLGIALLGAFAAARFVPAARIAGAMLLLGLFIGGVARYQLDFQPPDPEVAFDLTGLNATQLESLDARFPIVVAAAEDFTVLNYREPPEIAQRLYYLMDFDSAKKYSGQTTFEDEVRTIPLLGLKGKAEPLLSFFAEHPSFYLVSTYTSTHEWLTRYLIDHGAHLDLRGKFVREAAANDIFFVTVESPGSLARSAATALPGPAHDSVGTAFDGETTPQQSGRLEMGKPVTARQ